ncbi:MAG: hypothetical protein JRH20_02055 [Deltaproteobacteria bacterium]|nr:hypothetical protein [Deltaproteobacteria bacterium]
MKKVILGCIIAAFLAFIAPSAHAQYAVGHRSFGVGSAMGAGYSKMDLQFSKLDDGALPEDMVLLLPTLELKLFLSDTLSLDISAPVSNIAFSNALRDYFFVTGEAYLNFHPSAPSQTELFVAPGVGFSYAFKSYDNEVGESISESAWAFHVPVRVGFEFNNPRRNFSWFIAARPFFNLVHGHKGDIKPGGGMMLELGVMAYTVSHQANRY